MDRRRSADEEHGGALGPPITYKYAPQLAVVGIFCDQNCIGHDNTDTLEPNLGCEPYELHPAFTSAADLSGTIGLEEADVCVIRALGQSLRVLLSGDAVTYGNGNAPIKGKRNANNAIVFQGDRCAATNQPANPSRHDAVALSAKLAASGALVKP